MLNVYTFLSTWLSITDWQDVAAPSGKAAIGPFGDIVEKIFGRVVIGNPGHGRAGPAGREAMNGALDHQEFLILAGGAVIDNFSVRYKIMRLHGRDEDRRRDLANRADGGIVAGAPIDLKSV